MFVESTLVHAVLPFPNAKRIWPVVPILAINMLALSIPGPFPKSIIRSQSPAAPVNVNVQLSVKPRVISKYCVPISK